MELGGLKVDDDLALHCFGQFAFSQAQWLLVAFQVEVPACRWNSCNVAEIVAWPRFCNLIVAFK